jgi:hypothetical protein
MNDEVIKEAFQKVKQDIFSLGNELAEVRMDLIEMKTELKLISNYLEDIKRQQFLAQTYVPIQLPTQTLIEPNTKDIPTDTPTVPSEIGGLIGPKTDVSTGNRGVPTDRPTNQQTDQHIPQHIKIEPKLPKRLPENTLDKASEILASLDSLKKEVRLKFKRLTSQEMQVFSVLYSLEDQHEQVDYKAISDKMSLSESSIRDYIGKIQAKGIPIIKEKLNNKRVVLHISSDLKKIASLNTIMQLRAL